MGPAYWRTQQMTQQQTPHAAMGHDQSISGNCAVCYITDSSDDPRLCVYRTLPSADGLIGRCKEGICRCLKFGFGQISRGGAVIFPQADARFKLDPKCRSVDACTVYRLALRATIYRSYIMALQGFVEVTMARLSA